jgi:hypothetical protein
MRLRSLIRGAVAGLAAPAIAACYTYTVQPIDRIPVGAAVRARISGSEADRLGHELGRDPGRLVEGEVLEKPDTGLLLSVPSVLDAQDGSVRRLHQRLVLSRSGILELEVRRLDTWKTAGVMAVAAAVLGYVAVRQFQGESAPGGSGKGGTDK